MFDAYRSIIIYVSYEWPRTLKTHFRLFLQGKITSAKEWYKSSHINRFEREKELDAYLN